MSILSHTARRVRRGFTLIELVVVIAILAILAGTAIPVASKMLESARRKSTRDELDALSRSACEYFRDTGNAPAGVVDLVTDPVRADSVGWAGPYVEEGLADPVNGKPGYQTDAWGFDYVLVATTGGVNITSTGEGGVAGNANDVSIAVDFTSIRREKTLDSMRIINQAIVLYNATYQATAPLPPTWSTALPMIVNRGFLPDVARYSNDGWGMPFVADPVGMMPLVRVKSSSMAP